MCFREANGSINDWDGVLTVMLGIVVRLSGARGNVATFLQGRREQSHLTCSALPAKLEKQSVSPPPHVFLCKLLL